jgi:hypothetical protein
MDIIGYIILFLMVLGLMATFVVLLLIGFKLIVKNND